MARRTFQSIFLRSQRSPRSSEDSRLSTIGKWRNFFCCYLVYRFWEGTNKTCDKHSSQTCVYASIVKSPWPIPAFTFSISTFNNSLAYEKEKMILATWICGFSFYVWAKIKDMDLFNFLVFKFLIGITVQKILAGLNYLSWKATAFFCWKVDWIANWIVMHHRKHFFFNKFLGLLEVTEGSIGRIGWS